MAFSVDCTSSMAITSRTGFSTPPTITGGLPWSRAAHPVPLAILAPTGATWSSTSLDSVSYGSQPSAAPSFQRERYRQLTRLALDRCHNLMLKPAPLQAYGTMTQALFTCKPAPARTHL